MRQGRAWWRRSKANPVLMLLAASVLFSGCASDPAPVEDRSFPSEGVVAPAPAAAATPRPDAPRYRVERGDTLYSIAFKRGLDYRDVANWNGIEPPYRIFVGQELRMSAPGAPSNVPIAAAPAAVPGDVVLAPGEEVVTRAAPDQSKAATVTTLSGAPAPASRSASPPPASVAPAPVAAPPKASAATALQPESTPNVPPASPTPKPAAELPRPPPEVVLAAKPETTTTPPAGNGTWRWPSPGKVVGTFVGGDQTRQGIDIAGKAGDPVYASADGDVVYSGNGLLGYGELIIIKHNANFLSAYGHNRKRLVQEGDKVKSGQQIAEMGSSASARDELHFEIRKNGKPVNPLDYLPGR
ncbi:MAG TPA: peptidoglycan DD-metalloendopeptidase family protein [Rudaea sp.]